MTVTRQERSRQNEEDLRYRHEGSMRAPQYLKVLCCIKSTLLCRQHASIYSCATWVLLQSS